MVMILRFKGHLSIEGISSVLKIAFGLTLSKSEVSNLLKISAKYLGPKYKNSLLLIVAVPELFVDNS